MTSRDVARFRAIVARRLGLCLRESQDAELAELLGERLSARRRVPLDVYLDALDAGDDDEIAALGPLLTVGETYFFRAREQLDVLTDVVLPSRPRSRGNELRLLSAGCSTGEEPYSLAISVREYEQALRPMSWRRWRVHAIDLSDRALDRARAGLYSEWSLRELPRELRERWFLPRGREHELRSELRAQVTFELGNLLDERALAHERGSFDVVFCRNVLMYFTPEAARRVVEKLTHLLASGGVLFLGHAEPLRGLSDAYTHETACGAFYHRLAPRPATPTRAVLIGAPDRRPPSTSAPVAAPVPTPVSSIDGRAATTELDAVRELVALERFEQALDALRRLPPEFARASAELLRALAHLGSGDLGAAESTCARLLEADEASVEAHVVLGLVAEHRGDPGRALAHHRAAVYLEPNCALSHLHLGRIQRRAGRLDEARLELAQALELLEREDPLRVALFGGGFGLPGLLAVCRNELRAIGGGGE